MNRRQFLIGAPAGLAAASWPDDMKPRIVSYLETHRRATGGYGWSSDITPQVTPTFGVVGSYVALELPIPAPGDLAKFVRNHYPVPERRRTERPLWRLDWEQVQTLLWLGEPVESFRQLAATWTAPSEFTPRYELGGNPVLQHQAMAVRIRKLFGLTPSDGDVAWKKYFVERRRKDGTFNLTPASDGSGGHLLNTLWGMLASDALGLERPDTRALIDWIRSGQLSSGAWTWSPAATLGAVDDVVYVWAALHLLALLGAKPTNSQTCAHYLWSLQCDEGGFQDRPGGEPNPLATWYALDSLRLLGAASLPIASRRAPRARRHAIPSGSHVFTMQIEAPGAGSPREAVLLARSLGIHLWTAKNSPPGWIYAAQAIADEQKVPVTFAIGNEEYGTYVAVPGLGCYSHLVDTVAPFGKDTGEQLPKKNHPYSWAEFRDTRLRALQKGGGRLIWQFLENEELTRALLDEAADKGTYSGIASFHFGNENFLHSQPYLHRWHGRISTIALQDAHGKESWWWGNQLTGFRTLFLASDPTWEGWLQALERQHVMAVRRDAVTGFKLHLAGGSPEVRSFVAAREKDWRWWSESDAQSRRPAGSLVALRAGTPHEVGAPTSGTALRLRLRAENTNQGLPGQTRSELVRMVVDGKVVEPRIEDSKQDRYYILHLAEEPGRHRAEAQVRVLETGDMVTIDEEWTGGGAA
ncbi:MAG TPA: prenyltransferase/squalene oxidase repeat-containing protein [Bryobacteraceae bacterium]|nr:prenyltransferase/squalene oxidase repeat-containing protein [Bryobacteraceae bacterium]